MKHQENSAKDYLLNLFDNSGMSDFSLPTGPLSYPEFKRRLGDYRKYFAKVVSKYLEKFGIVSKNQVTELFFSRLHSFSRWNESRVRSFLSSNGFYTSSSLDKLLALIFGDQYDDFQVSLQGDDISKKSVVLYKDTRTAEKIIREGFIKEDTYYDGKIVLGACDFPFVDLGDLVSCYLPGDVKVHIPKSSILVVKEEDAIAVIQRKVSENEKRLKKKRAIIEIPKTS